MNNPYKTPRRERVKTPSLSDSDDRSKDAVEVFCRLRPLKDDRESCCIKLLSPSVLALITPTESKQPRKEIHCKFKQIFTAYATQNEVFEHVAYPLLENLLCGKNGLLFTYGVTGSGKTFTLTGDHNSPGVMPKSIYTIFNTIGDYQAPKFIIKSDRMNGFEIQSEQEALQDKFNELRKTSKTPIKRKIKERIYVNDNSKIMDIDTNNLYSVFVSYIEIYNNTVYDLLDENTTSGKAVQGKILREDFQKNMYVNGVVEVEVKSAEEAFEMFNQGQRRKKMGITILNSESSRSHSIFNIRVVQFKQVALNEGGERIIPDSNQLRVAQLSLVDLAGSERTNRTQNTGKLLKEASQINNSLLTLRTCLEILRENQQTGSNRLVPYRDSRLTLLFKNYFEGEGKVSMIVCVNPSVDDFEENLQVMKFAEVTQDVKVGRTERPYAPYTPYTTPRTITKAKTRSAPSFSLGPSIPLLNFDPNNIRDFLDNLDKIANVVKIREEKLLSVEEEINQRETHFRKRLIDINQENVLNKNEIKSNKILLKKEKTKSYNLEKKLENKEAEHRDLMNKNEELQVAIRNLRSTINEKDLKINKNTIEKEKIRQKLALASEKMSHELDAKLRRQREHLQAEMKAKEHKLRKVKELLEKDVTPPDVYEDAKENINYEMETEIEQTPQRSRARIVATPSSAARHRRSRSVGAEVWLEHNVVKPVPLNTVMQPSIKKRKSVTTLNKASDVTNPKQSKYCLIAQEQDIDGEVETKVYKADILPTTGGGAQVIFNDVERLRQESPTKSD